MPRKKQSQKDKEFYSKMKNSTKYSTIKDESLNKEFWTKSEAANKQSRRVTGAYKKVKDAVGKKAKEKARTHLKVRYKASELAHDDFMRTAKYARVKDKIKKMKTKKTGHGPKKAEFNKPSKSK